MPWAYHDMLLTPMTTLQVCHGPAQQATTQHRKQPSTQPPAWAMRTASAPKATCLGHEHSNSVPSGMPRPPVRLVTCISQVPAAHNLAMTTLGPCHDMTSVHSSIPTRLVACFNRHANPARGPYLRPTAAMPRPLLGPCHPCAWHLPIPSNPNTQAHA